MAETVLVLDDNRDFGDLLLGGLDAEGYRCIRASVSDGALGEFHNHAPDAVVIALPQLCTPGINLIGQIKAASPHTVVVAVGERGGGQNAVKALKHGADDFLPEPCSPAQLSLALKKHLKKASKDRHLALSDHPYTEDDMKVVSKICVDAPAAILHVDETGIIRFANKAATKTLGRHTDELIGNQFGAFVSERIRLEFFEHLHRQAKRPQGFSGELYLMRGDGDWFPARLKAVERPVKGQLVIFLDDLTSQKMLEKHLYESKRLASLGHVVEGVAHEVRNPLIAIGGFARKLNRSSAPDTAERRYTDIILTEVERLELMVRDIEDYLKFAKSGPSTFSSADISELVAEACADFGGFSGSGEKVDIEISRATDKAQIFCDSSRLLELFRGLVKNACEAMPEGGRIYIRVSEITGWIKVEIEDTGLGIAQSDLAEMFNPFFTSKTKGAGLGLAKAFMIVEDHEGEINFESEPGKGTVCVVSLPVDRRRVFKGARH